MQVKRDSRRSISTIRGGSQQPRFSEVQIAEEECSFRYPNGGGQDRLLPKLIKNPFDFLQIGEFEEKDPFCQGLRLVLNYQRPKTSFDEIESQRGTQNGTVKLKIMTEMAARTLDSIIERSFELGSLNTPMQYFHNRQIAWLKTDLNRTGNEFFQQQSSVGHPVIFFWNNAIVYANGAFKHYHATSWEDISAVEFLVAHIGMIGQRNGDLNLYDFEKQIAYRSILGESVNKHRRAVSIKDLVLYHYTQSSLGFALYGSVLKGLDFSLKDPVCCEYSSKDWGFIPNKAKLLDSNKIAMHGTESKSIVVWDVRNRNEPMMNLSFKSEIDLLDCNPNDSSQLVFSSFTTVYLYSLRTCQIQDSVECLGMVVGLTWHNDGRISVLHADLQAVLMLFKINELGKLQQEEEIPTTELHHNANVFTAEGCKHSTQLLVLGDLDFHSPRERAPNFAMMRF